MIKIVFNRKVRLHYVRFMVNLVYYRDSFEPVIVLRTGLLPIATDDLKVKLTS